MMNNRGVTVVEILVSFILISILIVGMMNVVYLYRGKISTSNYRKQLITYKNTLTKDIYNDILKKKVYDVKRCDDNEKRCIEFSFGLQADDVVTKKLEISNTSTDDEIRNKYISYGDQIYKIYEELPSGLTDLKKYEVLKFTTDGILFTVDNLGTDTVYNVDIGINHVDMIDDFGIHLTFIRGE